ncbi:family 35 putative beta-galactosidase glycoside hydrolase [Fusarium oxysporum Fo47]|uniref:Uncharacterized protein n=1 Tax=Fusarium oxysporum Fo47 TaxID=660027 RepID=W9JFC0_FUSOX|nr:family 35 putative beta-galactosidase glycoside hydrolase [Fusarium oxysporum Fo47]EWZ28168.1 hypothetical protein FOZG_18132 [Fusarium oxysporum Fo47]QKD57321.1 family 35 putative beta-galactosidase glycoside hydrolase [Fusarium oxysporum Fo47]
MSTTQTKCLPCLKKVGGRWQLQVDGKPFLILGGELQNSSMSSARYMKTIWKNLKDMGINTVLGAVAWEDIEPEEGRFTFSELDTIIQDAQSHGLRLILLWFGSFKNGMSSYVPPWVKTNIQRFPRMQLRQRDGELYHTNVISILHDECLEADRRAFTKLMNYIKETDVSRTVIAVQVQNEVGLLSGPRDVGPVAESAFQADAPSELVKLLERNWDCLPSEFTNNFPTFVRTRADVRHQGLAKSWEQHFGKSSYTDELFMAYHYACYVEKIAAAGKQAYDIPLFTNAWLPMPGTQDASGNIASGGAVPGEYPSGGPTPNLLHVWQWLTPSLDFISPDIYAGDYGQICSRYAGNGQPFFIPEQRRDDYGARRIWEAIGSHGALGAAPFGVDTLRIDNCSFKSHYELLSSISPLLLKAREESAYICGFFFDGIPPGSPDTKENIVKLATSYELSISRSVVFGQPGPGYGLIIELDEDRFLLVGTGFKVQFKPRSGTSVVSGLLRLYEKEVADQNGTLRTARHLNGDESRSGTWANMPGDESHIGESAVPIAIPARTGIAEVQVYQVE